MLIVEDNEGDVFLIKEAMLTTGLRLTLNVVKDGEQAMQFFDRAGNDPATPCPALVILDINLPKKQGGDVLEHLRRHSKCGDVPVIAVSTSDSAQDRERMARLGADGYFRKPSDYDEFMKLGGIVQALLRDAGSLRKPRNSM